MRLEESICTLFRPIVSPLNVGDSIPDSREFQLVLQKLEHFLAACLAEVDPEWKHQSFDGFLPAYAIKSRDRTLDIYGLCIFISDQTTAAIHLELELADGKDEFSKIICRVGERSEHGMIRASYSKRDRDLSRIRDMKDRINWAYQIGYP